MNRRDVLLGAALGMGGMVAAIERGFPQREIQEAAFQFQKAVDGKEKIIVGVNDFIEENEQLEIPILMISPDVEIKQKRRTAELRQSRNGQGVITTLDALRQSAEDGTNLIPRLLDCTRAYVTLGEMCNALAEVFGVYEEPAVF